MNKAYYSRIYPEYSSNLDSTALSSNSSLWISGVATSDINPSWKSSDWSSNYVPYHTTYRVEDKFIKRVYTRDWYNRR